MIKGLNSEKVLSHIKKVEKELRALYSCSSLALYCIGDLVDSLEMYLGYTNVKYTIKKFNKIIKNFRQVFFEEEKVCAQFIKENNGALAFAILTNFDTKKTAEKMLDIAIKEPFILTTDNIKNLRQLNN